MASQSHRTEMPVPTSHYQCNVYVSVGVPSGHLGVERDQCQNTQLFPVQVSGLYNADSAFMHIFCSYLIH